MRWIFLLAVSLMLSACSLTSFTLWVANALADTGEYQHAVDQAYGADPEQRLDIYYQNVPVNASEAETKKPVIVFFYGGCWGACTDLAKQDYRFVAEALVDQAVVVIADYRRYPTVLFPDIMRDAAEVVSWVERSVAEYGGDAEQLFLMGHSSGAHMAVMLALNKQYLPRKSLQHIQGVIGLAGPYDFLPLDKTYQQILFGPEERYPESQPINYASTDQPPLMLLHGTADDTVKMKNLDNLVVKTQQFQGQVEAHRYEGVEHAELLGLLSIPLRGSSTVRADIQRFISKYSLKPGVVSMH